MTLSKVQKKKKLPNYMKRNQFVLLQVQRQAVKGVALEQPFPHLESVKPGRPIAQVGCCHTCSPKEQGHPSRFLTCLCHLLCLQGSLQALSAVTTELVI